MYIKSYIDKKITGIISCINLNSNSEKSSHISIERHAPKLFLAGAVLGCKGRNHVYSGVKLSKQDGELHMRVWFLEGGHRSSPIST